jgi:hypothetical protein
VSDLSIASFALFLVLLVDDKSLGRFLFVPVDEESLAREVDVVEVPESFGICYPGVALVF